MLVDENQIFRPLYGRTGTFSAENTEAWCRAGKTNLHISSINHSLSGRSPMRQSRDCFVKQNTPRVPDFFGQSSCLFVSCQRCKVIKEILSSYFLISYTTCMGFVCASILINFNWLSGTCNPVSANYN